MHKRLILSALLLSCSSAWAQAELDEHRLNNWGAQWANMKLCEDAGYLAAGTMQFMRSRMEQGLSAQTLQQLNQVYNYSLQNKVVYARRIQNWIPVVVTPEFCAGYVL